MVLLHGLTATRRYVVMGSNGLAVATWAHRECASTPAAGESARALMEPSGAAYEYGDLSPPGAVLDQPRHRSERAVLWPASMGAATASPALPRLERGSTTSAGARPRRDGGARPDHPGLRRRAARRRRDMAAWLRLADGLESAGVDGFLDAWDPTMPTLPRHRHDRDASGWSATVTPRRWPTRCGWSRARSPSRGSRSSSTRAHADRRQPRRGGPSHPYAVGAAYCRLPNARLVIEEEGKSPLAWQGARLSKEIAGFLARRAARALARSAPCRRRRSSRRCSSRPATDSRLKRPDATSSDLPGRRRTGG